VPQHTRFWSLTEARYHVRHAVLSLIEWLRTWFPSATDDDGNGKPR
jgi:hypothetical protein